MNIDVRDKGKAAVSTTGEGNVSIELNGGSTLRSGYEHAGLEKNNGGSLTIADEDKNGKLTAWGGQQGAGIGGGSGKDWQQHLHHRRRGQRHRRPRRRRHRRRPRRQRQQHHHFRRQGRGHQRPQRRRHRRRTARQRQQHHYLRRRGQRHRRQERCGHRRRPRTEMAATSSSPAARSVPAAARTVRASAAEYDGKGEGITVSGNAQLKVRGGSVHGDYGTGRRHRRRRQLWHRRRRGGAGYLRAEPRRKNRILRARQCP